MAWAGLLFFAYAMLPADYLTSWLFWTVLILAAAFLLYFPDWLSGHLQKIKRNQLLNTRRGVASIRALSWQDFELLVGNAYQRLGYRLTETGGGGADGGVDLILRKDGQKILVQCKRWNSGNVGATVVREMYGLMAHHQAHAVKIISASAFTKDAIAFAKGKPIELVDGTALCDLVAMVRQHQGHAVDGCPDCGSPMVKRHNKKQGRMFYGCEQFPACRGTRPMPDRLIREVG